MGGGAIVIFIRRTLAVILVLFFFLSFAAALLVWRIDSTVLDAEYVKAELVEADIYGFAYDTALPVLVEEALSDPEALTTDELEDLRLDPEADAPVVVGALSDFLPRDELQTRVEHVIDQVWPYLSGDADDFAIQLRVGERVRELPDIFATRLPELRFGDRVVEAALAPRIVEAAAAVKTSGFDPHISRERARQAAGEIAPGPWVEDQIVGASRGLSEWVTKAQPDFTVRIQYADQIPRAAEEIKRLLDETRAEDFLFENVIQPNISQAVGKVTQLSHGIEISDREVNRAIEKVAPRAWVAREIDAAIDSLSLYFSGQTDELRHTVALQERREEAIADLKGLVASKLQGVIDALPDCASNADALQAVQEAASGRLPTCLAPQIDRDQLRAVLLSALNTTVDEQLAPRIPDSVTFDLDDLEQVAGEEPVSQIREARRFIVEGFVFTDGDLMEALEESGEGPTPDDVDLVRDLLSDEHTFTAEDLLSRIDDAAASDLESLRSGLSRFSRYSMLSFLIPGLLLVIIAFLAGRSWPSRLGWAAAAVTVSALFIWILAGPVWDATGGEVLDEAVTEGAADVEPPAQALVEELLHRAVGVVNGWTADYANTGRNFFVAGLVVTVAAVWWRWSARVQIRESRTAEDEDSAGN